MTAPAGDGSGRRAWLESASVGVAVLVLCSLTWWHGLQEGKSVVGAERVLAGDIPYRDFWTMYAPGYFYVLAAMFAIFGTHIVVGSVTTAVTCAISGALLYRLLLFLSGRRVYAVCGLVVVAAAFFASNYYRWFGSYPPAFVFMLLALTLYTSYLRKPRRALLIAAGLSTGLVAVFKHDVAAYTGLAIGAGLLVQGALVEDGDRRQRLAATAGTLVRFGLGAAVPIVLVGGFFALLAGRDMLQDLVIFPATDFRYSRTEGFPGLLPLGVYDPAPARFALNLAWYISLTLPTLLVAATSIWVLLAARRRPLYAPLAATFAVAYVPHWTSSHVQLNTHVISLSLYALCSLALLVRASGERREAGGELRMRWLAPVVPLLMVVWTLSLALDQVHKRWVARNEPAPVRLTLPKVSGVAVSPEEAAQLTALTEFVQEHVPPDQRIFVGNHRHDIVIVNDTVVYYVVDRAPATRHQELHPAIADTATVQAEIIRDLERYSVSLIVLKNIFGDESLDRQKRRMRQHLPQVGAEDLDRYIRENFEQVERFGRYTVWLRKTPGPAPG